MSSGFPLRPRTGQEIAKSDQTGQTGRWCPHDRVSRSTTRQQGVRIYTPDRPDVVATQGAPTVPYGQVDADRWACDECGAEFVTVKEAMRRTKRTHEGIPGSTLPMDLRLALAAEETQEGLQMRAGFEKQGLDWRTGEPLREEPKPKVTVETTASQARLVKGVLLPQNAEQFRERQHVVHLREGLKAPGCPLCGGSRWR